MDGSLSFASGYEQNFWLTRSVARVMGVNLGHAIRNGILKPEEYQEMVTRCHTANCHETCQQWLAGWAGTVSEAPAHCVHRDLLNRLR